MPKWKQDIKDEAEKDALAIQMANNLQDGNGIPLGIE